MAVAVDVGLAVVVGGVVVIAIQVAGEPIERAPDAFAYVLGGLMGVVLVVRRRWPLAVLLATIAILLVYYSLGYPNMAPAVPLAVALFSVAIAGRFRWAMLAAAALVVGGLVARVIEFDMPALPLVNSLISDAALLASIVLLGETLRSGRERLAAAHAEREREVARERLRISRDMHDGLGQTIAAVTVQAALADDVLDKDPAKAREALQVIRRSTRQALRELKAVLAVLRDERLPGLGQIEALLDVARKSGLQVTKVVSGDPWRASPVLDHTAYRVVQESLTNTIRHANATTVTVELRYSTETLVVQVTDDGSGSNPVRRGFGLSGMAERVTALNGRLDAAARPEGGFRVRAELHVEAP